MHLKSTLDLHTENPLQQPVAGSPASELVNHETLWLKNFLSRQTQQTYRAVFREFCQLGQITSPDALRQVTPAEIIAYRDYLIEEKKMRPRSVRSRHQHPGRRARQRHPASALFYRLPDLGAWTPAGEGSL